MHEFLCLECGDRDECQGRLCEGVPHRCVRCQRERPRLRPSGDVISEAKWPTRRGDPPPREA